MRTFLSLLLLLCLCSCASSRAASQGRPTEVHFFGGDTHLSILNDARLREMGIEGADANERRLAYSSQERSDPNAKVATDEEMEGLLQAFDELGWTSSLSGPGSAPRGSEYGWALEVHEGAAKVHAVNHGGLPADQKIALIECVKVFNAVYNVLPQYQAVPEDVGRGILENFQSGGRQ